MFIRPKHFRFPNLNISDSPMRTINLRVHAIHFQTKSCFILLQLSCCIPVECGLLTKCNSSMMQRLTQVYKRKKSEAIGVDRHSPSTQNWPAAASSRWMPTASGKDSDRRSARRRVCRQGTVNDEKRHC